MKGLSRYQRGRWTLGGALLALTGCATPVGTGDAAEPAAPPSTGATTDSPSPSPSPTAGPSTHATIPGRDQAFMLQGVDRVEDPVLTVTASGRVGTYPGGADTGDREQFTLSPLSPGATSYLLKTAKLRVGGEALCVGVDGTTVQTMPCDASNRKQFVTLPAPGGAGGPTGATFDLVIGGYNLEVTDPGKLSVVRRTGPARTTFRFILVTGGA